MGIRTGRSWWRTVFQLCGRTASVTLDLTGSKGQASVVTAGTWLQRADDRQWMYLYLNM